MDNYPRKLDRFIVMLHTAPTIEFYQDSGRVISALDTFGMKITDVAIICLNTLVRLANYNTRYAAMTPDVFIHFFSLNLLKLFREQNDFDSPLSFGSQDCSEDIEILVLVAKDIYSDIKFSLDRAGLTTYQISSIEFLRFVGNDIAIRIAYDHAESLPSIIGRYRRHKCVSRRRR